MKRVFGCLAGVATAVLAFAWVLIAIVGPTLERELYVSELCQGGEVECLEREIDRLEADLEDLREAIG